MMRFALFFFVFMSAGLVAVALFLGGYINLGLIALVLGVLWIFGLTRSWEWVPALGLFGTYSLVVVGFLFDSPSILLIAAAFSALLAWDLADLIFRLRLAAPGDETSVLQRRRLIMLSLVFLAGVVMVLFTLTVHLSFTFEWMALLLLFAVWGVGRIVSGLLRHTQR